MRTFTFLYSESPAGYNACVQKVKCVYPNHHIGNYVPKTHNNYKLSNQAAADFEKVKVLAHATEPTLYIDADVILTKEIELNYLTKPAFAHVHGDPDVWMIYSNGTIDHQSFFEKCYNEMMSSKKINSITLQSIVYRQRNNIELIKMDQSIKHLYLSRG